MAIYYFIITAVFSYLFGHMRGMYYMKQACVHSLCSMMTKRNKVFDVKELPQDDKDYLSLLINLNTSPFRRIIG